MNKNVRWLCLLMAAVCVLMSLSACGRYRYTFENGDADLQVVTFNCAAPWGSLTDNTLSSVRVKRFAAYMNAVSPDLIGTQEMNAAWLKRLDKLLPDYGSYGVPRGGDDNKTHAEMNAVFWKADRFDCLEKNTFWLSETPETESKYEGAGCNRICTYVVLRDQESGSTVLHLNTHLDNASDEARGFGADVILDRLSQLQQQYPDAAVILTGDLNDVAGGVPSQKLDAVLASCVSVLTEPAGATYTDWGAIQDADGEPIDFIYTNKTPISYRLLNDLSNGYVSDHYGVYAEINY